MNGALSGRDERRVVVDPCIDELGMVVVATFQRRRVCLREAPPVAHLVRRVAVAEIQLGHGSLHEIRHGFDIFVVDDIHVLQPDAAVGMGGIDHFLSVLSIGAAVERRDGVQRVFFRELPVERRKDGDIRPLHHAAGEQLRDASYDQPSCAICFHNVLSSGHKTERLRQIRQCIDADGLSVQHDSEVLILFQIHYGQIYPAVMFQRKRYVFTCGDRLVYKFDSQIIQSNTFCNIFRSWNSAERLL